MPMASLSSRVVPPAMTMADGRAIAALTPWKVASPDRSSTVVVPAATFTRPAALAGMSLIVAPPEKAVHSPSRLRSTAMPVIAVPPELTASARTVPEMAGMAA